MDIHRIYREIMTKFDSCTQQSVITSGIVSDSVKKRAPESHKGTCGSLLICAGSRGLTGAAVLAASSALRCGCGLVTLACSEELNDIFEIKLTEAMTLPLPSCGGAVSYAAKDLLFDKMRKSSAFLIGPGLSQTDDIRRLVCETLEECRVPLVIDADALNVISADTSVLKKAKCPVIITPHIGEFARLCQKTTKEIMADKENLAAQFAKEFGCIVVLKSHRTIVAAPNGEQYVNLLGNPGMATGGSGDVLAGAVASFAAQGCSGLKSALAGVYFHSLAGDIAASITGEYSLIASDIINCLMYAIKETCDEAAGDIRF